MRQRITGIALALTLVLLALLVGLASLVREVTAERADGRAGLLVRERLVTEQARNRLLELLTRSFGERRRLIEEALEKPLQPCPGCYYNDGQRQQLPRLAPGPNHPNDAGPNGTRTGTAVRDAHRELLDGALSGDDPWSMRVALQRACRAGQLDASSDILAHNARFAFPVELEMASTMAVVGECAVSSALARALLRDGIETPGGRRVEGLQPQVLRRLGDLSRADADYVLTQTRALSAATHVKIDDFEMRLREMVDAPLLPDASRPAVNDLPVISRTPNDHWYLLEPASVGMRGMYIDFGTYLATVVREMQARSLLNQEDRLHLRIPERATVALSQLSLAVVSPDMERARAAQDRRYTVKLALLALCGLMGIVIAVLGIAFQKRRRRVLELKSHFVASVSHELRTPLASMRLLAETLARKTAGQTAVRDYPERLLRDIDGMTFLVENILSFNRLAKGRWRPRKELVHLGEVIVSACAEAAEVCPHEVTYTEDPGDARITGDPELLQLLFRNLATNAVTYNKRRPATIAVTIAMTIENRKQHQRVLFRDNGVGVPDDERDRVFAEFERGTTGSMARGSGLGLSLCRRVMALHGGTITIVRSSKEGTEFQLNFPCTSS